MVTATTNSIKISVETFYQPDYSYPMNQHFMFAYRITIENYGTDTVQLLRRHWNIIDGFGQRREVEGEGVVGEQPIIRSGEKYVYVSGCDFKTQRIPIYTQSAGVPLRAYWSMPSSLCT